MKKISYNTILLTIAIFIGGCSSNAQPDPGVVSVLRKTFRNVSEYELLFLENELIEYCRDSLGRVNFEKAITERKQLIAEDESILSREFIVLFELLNHRINNVVVKETDQQKSKEFILNLLADFKVNFTVDEQLLLDLFDYRKRDLAEMEDCDVAITNFVFFVYDPALYVKVLKEHPLPDYDINRPHFIGCTLENYDDPIQFRRKMRDGLLEFLNAYSGPEIRKIYNDIKNAQLAGSND